MVVQEQLTLAIHYHCVANVAEAHLDKSRQVAQEQREMKAAQEVGI